MSSEISMFWLVFTILMGIAKSEPPPSTSYGTPSTSYGTPLAAPISSYGTPNYNAGSNDDHHDHGEPKSYEFGYQVKDDYSGNNYNRKESSDGNQVRGEYRVALPDGRTQIVTYWADWQSGFHADVKYEGTAQYPDQSNQGYPPSNQYGPPSNQYGPPSNQYGPPSNQYIPPSNQYGPPSNQYGAPSNQYGAPSYSSGGAAATSSVSIKDYSSGGGNYNSGYDYSGGYPKQGYQ